MTKPVERSELAVPAKILIPIGDLFSKELITTALHILSIFQKPIVILFHVVEVPSRTGALEPEPYREQIKTADAKLRELAKWLADQGLIVETKVAVARSAADGIIAETENEPYQIVFLMKRQAKKGWKRLFTRSVTERVIRSVSCLVMTAPLEIA